MIQHNVIEDESSIAAVYACKGQAEVYRQIADVNFTLLLVAHEASVSHHGLLL
jgi:hypothetical protein